MDGIFHSQQIFGSSNAWPEPVQTFYGQVCFIEVFFQWMLTYRFISFKCSLFWNVLAYQYWCVMRITGICRLLTFWYKSIIEKGWIMIECSRQVQLMCFFYMDFSVNGNQFISIDKTCIRVHFYQNYSICSW